MSDEMLRNGWSVLRCLFKPHPWHGVSIGPNAPATVTSYIELVPTDNVKYEIDKDSGYLRVDRPQQFSNVCPSLYGFIPQTLCGPLVAKRSGMEGHDVVKGDDDPMDICVFSENSFPRGDILMDAVPIGGFRMLDGGVSDEKIIAVLKGDAIYGRWRDLPDCPPDVLSRLRHYFLTYKHPPGEEHGQIIISTYNREECHKVIELSRRDYRERFPDILATMRQLERDPDEVRP